MSRDVECFVNMTNDCEYFRWGGGGSGRVLGYGSNGLGSNPVASQKFFIFYFYVSTIFFRFRVRVRVSVRVSVSTLCLYSMPVLYYSTGARTLATALLLSVR